MNPDPWTLYPKQQSLYPKPRTLHPAHPAPCAPPCAPCTLHTLRTLHPASYQILDLMHPTPYTLNPKPRSAAAMEAAGLGTDPGMWNQVANTKPYTLHPKS